MAIVLDGTAGITTPDLTDTSLTSGRVVYAGTSGNLTGSSGLTFDGTDSRLFLNTTSSVGAEQAIIAFNSAGTYSQALNTRDTNASASGNAHIVLRKSDNTYIGSFGRQSTDTAMFVDGNEYLALRVNQTEKMRLTSTGLGIGTTTIGNKLTVADNSASAMIYGTQSGAGDLFALANSSSEKFRVTNAGNVQINTTSSLDAVVSVVGQVGANAAPFSLKVATNGDYGFTFKNSSGALSGAIGVDASTVSYNTSSDYRLKNTIAPMTGALAKVAQLKPVTYKWNVDGSDGEGFIAHELAEVCPHAVVGEKDAVDADGNIKSQGVDTSFLVATLTAAIQELKAEFDAYKALHP
jgi:hypothetical protein